MARPQEGLLISEEAITLTRYQRRMFVLLPKGILNTHLNLLILFIMRRPHILRFLS